MSKPTMGIMTLYTRNKTLEPEESRFFRQVIAAGNKLGMDVFVFTPEETDDSRRRVRAFRYDADRENWSREWTGFPDVIYDRCRTMGSPNFVQMSRFRSKHPELIYLNRPLRHKWGVHLILSRSASIRSHLPETVLYREPKDLNGMLSKYPLLYLKPRSGTGGTGIVSIRRLGDGKYLLQGRNRKRKIILPRKLTSREIIAYLQPWGLTGHYLIQQGISTSLPDGRVHDFRLLIQKNGEGHWEVTGTAGRIGPKRSVTSNLHGGGTAEPADRLLSRSFPANQVRDIRLTMNRLAHQVVGLLEQQFGRLCELALDLAVGPDGRVWLLEVNPKPAREVFHRIGEKETYDKSIRRPVEYALSLAGQ